jgi:hypothetical protein
MAREIKDHGPKVENRWRKILFAQILYPADLLYPAG